MRPSALAAGFVLIAASGRDTLSRRGGQLISGARIALITLAMTTTPVSASAAVPSGAHEASPGLFARLSGVSCATPESCVAVGQYGNGWGVPETLAESWHGGSWSVMPSPSPGSWATLDAVSCPTGTSCVAVGTSTATTATGTRTRSLVEAWDGTKWRLLTSPSPRSETELSAVSCPSTRSCIALGSVDFETPLVERWNGVNWSILTGPSPGVYRQLFGLSCPTASFCIAVGSVDHGSGQTALVETWNDAAWSVVSSPSPGSDGSLDAVSCSSPQSCLALGSYGNQMGRLALVESWNGTAWSVVPIPKSAAVALVSVSCTSATSCTAAGTEGANNLTVSWNGSRALTVTARSPAPTGTFLAGATCLSDASCTAVGASGYATSARAVDESWNGRSWSLGRITRAPSTVARSGPELRWMSCFGGVYEPPSFVLSCADANALLLDIHWSSWSSSSATASATYSLNDCTPDCAGGTFHDFAAKVTLSSPTQTRFGRLFAHLSVRYVKDGRDLSVDLGSAPLAPTL